MKEIPASIGKLKNLIWLYLYGNNLQDLPDEIRGLKKLRSFQVGDNPLVDDPAKRERIQKLLPHVRVVFADQD